MAQSKVLAGRLSSFEESEDDCDQRVKKVDAKYCISYFNEEVLDISPWYEKERMFMGQKMDRVQTQTIPTHGFLLDKPTETKPVTFESAEAMCEILYDHKSIEYATSAGQRILQTLSVIHNMDNLLSWFSVDSPEGAQVLKIEPHTRKLLKILDCWYLKDEQLYVLLVLIKPSWTLIEIWPLRNLLIPKKVLLPDESLDQKNCKLCCDSKYICVWCEDALYVYCTSSTEMIHKICFDFKCLAFSLTIKDTGYLANEESELYSLNIQTGLLTFLKCLPPLCQPPPSALLVRHTFLAVASDNMLFYYSFGPSHLSKYFNTQLNSQSESHESEIILMEPQHIAVLYRKRQIICVFLMENTNRPEYEFKFTNAENVIAACWSKNALYTLTDDGVLSKWIILTHGRKMRERFLKTGLSECFKILAIENDKFFICCNKLTVGIKWNT